MRYETQVIHTIHALLESQEGGPIYTCDLCSSNMRTVRSYQVLQVGWDCDCDCVCGRV